MERDELRWNMKNSIPWDSKDDKQSPFFIVNHNRTKGRSKEIQEKKKH